VSRSSENPVLAAALQYARLGFRVLPVYGLFNGACACPKGESCESPGKHPRSRRGVNDATTDSAKILSAFASWLGTSTTTNIGIATGAESGIFVLDVDPRHGGEDSLRALESEQGQLPGTLESKTGGGGRHIYFKHPGGRVPNKVGIRPGLDVRGDGGYVVAPPSLHVSGEIYTWQRGHGPDQC